MTWVILAAVATLVLIPVVQSLAADEARGWLPYASRALIRASVRVLPIRFQTRYLEEWLADLATFSDRPLSGFGFAVQVRWAAKRTARSLGSQGDQSPSRLAPPARPGSSRRPVVDSSPSRAQRRGPPRRLGLARAEAVNRHIGEVAVHELQALCSGILRDPRNWLTPGGFALCLSVYATSVVVLVTARLATEIRARPRGRAVQRVLGPALTVRAVGQALRIADRIAERVIRNAERVMAERVRPHRQALGIHLTAIEARERLGTKQETVR